MRYVTFTNEQALTRTSWLFQGEISGTGGDSGCEGDVRWRWRPSPQLEARGTRQLDHPI